MCRTGIIGMTSSNENMVKFAFDLRCWWCENGRLARKLQQRVGSLEQELLMFGSLFNI